MPKKGERKPQVDYVGRRYGKLVVIEYAGYKTAHYKSREATLHLWKCKCDCGNEIITYSSNLSGHHIESCGCIRKGVDLSNNRYGKLTVIKESTPRIRKDRKSVKRVWECLCDCGNTTYVIHENLISGTTKSCGCLKKEVNKPNPNAVTQKYARLYRIWRGIKTRSTLPNDQHHKYYYDKGITICSEWKNSFKSFLEWALSHGYADNLTIDRIDVNGNYEPNNCRWVTPKQQSRNKTNTPRYNIFGEMLTPIEIEEKYGVKRGTFLARVKRYGFTPEAAITTPIMRKNP